jgi:hypothetical protein
MPDVGSPVDEIQLGVRVAYRLGTGEPAHGVRAKVLGLFNTRNGPTLADVEWYNLGSLRRLNVINLTKG